MGEAPAHRLVRPPRFRSRCLDVRGASSVGARCRSARPIARPVGIIDADVGASGPSAGHRRCFPATDAQRTGNSDIATLVRMKSAMRMEIEITTTVVVVL